MCPPGQMVCCGPMLNRRRILRRRSGPCGGSGLWLLKSKIFRGRPVSKRYSAFSTPLHPIPLPTLQNAAGGPFWAVLAAFCGDFDAGCVVVCCAGAGRASSIHGLHRAAGCPGVGSFGCLSEERLLDVFESAQVLDSYAQQVLRFRVLVL